ncbi:uncharacterized protein LOC121734486 [Aricia agestis]|uniref:uncharacterized protein LOC121734486 n=1 Tax=Aricia agestis TaxID=91739 RepID=UPI001C2094C1|nr:uncharacterized protein LOC121734486 [Aricia agestis]
MEDKLLELYIKLDEIKEYICKLGPKRRTGPTYELKINEANSLNNKFEECVQLLPSSVSKEILGICINIRKVYSKILSYKILEKMSENFCLKTAVSLLPKMNGDESVTRELIDAIELYSSMISNDGKQLLINFILKTRISDSAKMRLRTEYADINSLLKDMRSSLLTIKSDTSLQAQLQSARQGNKSIKEFGNEIERLFVDLTISQANNDPDAYKILRPVNEKNAIKRFSDGLQSQRLGTIIAARNFSQLKDAIRAAEDETSSRPEQIASYSKSRNYNSFRGRNNYNRFQYYLPRPMHNNML